MYLPNLYAFNNIGISSLAVDIWKGAAIEVKVCLVSRDLVDSTYRQNFDVFELEYL